MENTLWYYVDRQRNRHGPVAAEAVRQAYAGGILDGASLVWREGLAEWTPLGQVATELGLDQVAPAAAPPPAALAAPKRSGCATAAIVIGGGGMVLLFFGAIIAAIAIPAYHDYLGRAKLMELLAETTPLKAAVAEFQYNTDRCPRGLDELGMEDLQIKGVEEIVVGAFEDGSCAIELHLGEVENVRKAAGNRIWLAMDEDGGFSCSADDALFRYLPQDCR
ncbi:MAG TPA: GYF domain-containing protein [Arenimonas sp.]|nr:GYF domain-containing protein [Arenimonas sp.]